MKNNISLSTLDEFAKRISSKQVNMLYENRMHKKYSKKVFESSADIFADNFCLYVAKINYDSDTHCVVCALVPVHELFVTRLEVSTGNTRKLETQSHQLLP